MEELAAHPFPTSVACLDCDLGTCIWWFAVEGTACMRPCRAAPAVEAGEIGTGETAFGVAGEGERIASKSSGDEIAIGCSELCGECDGEYCCC